MLEILSHLNTGQNMESHLKKSVRIVTKVGDIYFVKVNDQSKKYFQYITNDITQLNSDVIRTFKKEYQINSNPNLEEIINDDIDFYSHCVVKLGIKMGYWKKIGNIKDVGNINNILFRSSGDYGNPKITISYNWWVWKINEYQKQVGKLEGTNQKAEIGSVFSPPAIVERIKTGKNNIVYPSYE